MGWRLHSRWAGQGGQQKLEQAYSRGSLGKWDGLQTERPVLGLYALRDPVSCKCVV